MKHLKKLLIVCLLLSQQACIVKRISAWPPEVEFNEGADLHIGTNGISDVSDSRGIGKKPKPQITQASDKY